MPGAAPVLPGSDSAPPVRAPGRRDGPVPLDEVLVRLLSGHVRATE